MKKVILLLFLAAFIGSCKKKADPEPEPITPAPQEPQVSVKINGTAFSCSNCYSAYQSGGLRGVTFNLANNDELIRFSCSSLPAPGTYPLSKSTLFPSMMYQKNNVYYKASSGSMTITSIDTSKTGVVNRMEVAFAFKTDTTSGVFYNVTEGSIHLK
jgi:hypothetical protein